MSDQFGATGEGDESYSRNWDRGWIAVVLIVLVVVCGIVLPPLVNANRFRASLSRELGAALGRPVQMENVSLRLLPRPGFDFENFEVAAEPQFGAEPVVRAAKVTVYIRLLPLWRGRVEVATISLQDASLNVARNAAGQWNFAALLERTSQLPAQTPTGKRRSEAGAPFPYVEVTNGRINFKRGEEKLPFSFTDAEFSLWLAQPGEWRLRFRAAPVRTDMNAAYTGDLRLEASVRRGTEGLRNARIAGQGSWRHAPLGQVGRVVLDEDRGWRGEASVDFAVNGTATNAAVQARLAIDGLRREDFGPAASLAVQADCNASLQLVTQMLQDAACVTLTGDGRLALQAHLLELNAPFVAQAYSVALDHVPAQWMLASLRLVRQGLSPDLEAEGDMSGRFAYDRDAPVHLSGQVNWQHGALRVSGEPAVQLPDVMVSAEAAMQPATRLRHRLLGRENMITDAGAQLKLLPLAVPLGGDAPLEIFGGISRAGYNLSVTGTAQLQRVAPLVRAFGFARWAVLRRVSGLVTADVQVHDAWMRNSASLPAQVQGTVALRNVSVDTAWLPGPIVLAQGKISLSPAAIAWQGLQWSWAGAKFDGAATHVSDCADTESCRWHVTAHAPLLNLQQILNEFRPSATDELLSLFRGNANAGWPPFQVDLNVDALAAGRLSVAHFSAGIQAANATLDFTRCSGTTLGSEMECFGNIALDRGTAEFSIAAARASLSAAGALFKETWGTGTAETSVELKFQRGNSPTGTFTAMLRNAEFAGAAASSPLARVQSWQMSGQVLSDHLQIDRSLLTSGGKDFPVTGSIGFDRRLSLDINPAGATPKHVSGSVASPRVQ